MPVHVNHFQPSQWVVNNLVEAVKLFSDQPGTLRACAEMLQDHSPVIVELYRKRFRVRRAMGVADITNPMTDEQVEVIVSKLRAELHK